MEEILDDTLKLHHRIEQRGNQLAKEMVEVLEASRVSILGKLSRLQDKILKGEYQDEPASRRKALLTAQKTEIERLLEDIYVEVGEKIREAGEDVIQAAGASTTATMNAALGLSVSFAKLPKDAVTSWFEMSQVEGLLVNDWLKKLEQLAVDRIVSSGRQAMVEGLGAQATARLMRQKGIEGSVPGLNGLARTWLQSAAHYAKEEVIKRDFDDFVVGWKYSATLDRRTCLVCGPTDGRIFKKDESRPVLPRHWACRCVYIPLPPTWRELGIDKDEMEEGTRPAVKHSGRTVHHRDGSTSTKFKVESVEHVPQSLTYQAWMKRQVEKDPDFVKSVLGKTRFELFKAGKLELKNMSADGRIKRLSEL
jgi:hypothetical protein